MAPLLDDPAGVAGSIPGSRKAYETGSRPDIRVPVREVMIDGGAGAVRLYDSSGPYTDADVSVDVSRGLPPLRASWIRERADVEEYAGREVHPRDDGRRSDRDPLANLAVFPRTRARAPLRRRRCRPGARESRR